MPSSSPWTKRYLELLQPLQRSLETYCRRALRNSSLVEDVLQSVVEKTFADFDRFAEGTNFRAWIFRYLHFEVLSCNRREFGEVGLRDDDQPSQSVNWEQVAAEQSFDRLLSDSEGILEIVAPGEVFISEGESTGRVTVNGRDVGDQLVAERHAVVRSHWR